MPAERLEMRRVREILRYRAEQGLGHKSIAVRVGAAPSTVRETLRRATAAGLSWPLDDDMSDAVLEAALYKAAGSTAAQDLSNVRLKEVVDGELGPMLTSYGKVIPEGQTRARRTKRTADVVDLDSRRSPKKAADRVASLEAALRGYRKALEGLSGNDELTRYRRTFMERSVKRTEQALKQMRKAAS